MIVGLLVGLAVGFFLGGLTAYMFEDVLRGPIMRAYDDWTSLRREARGESDLVEMRGPGGDHGPLLAAVRSAERPASPVVLPADRCGDLHRPDGVA